MSPRMPLPDLEAAYDLAPSQIEAFQRDGHVLLRSVASPEEIAAYRPGILAAREQFGAERTPLESRDTYEGLS